MLQTVRVRGDERAIKNPVNIRQLLADLMSTALPRSEARMLLSHVLKREQAWLVAHDDHELSTDELTRISALAARRAKGEPVAYLLGEREFYGRTFRCTPAALIPRPETELLVDLVVACLSSGSPGNSRNNPPRVLDVGTGTGCIAITIALEHPHALVTALDVSADALALARENAARLGATNVQFLESSWFAAVADDASFDLIVSNPPYIVPGDVHLSQGDLRFEPAIALADTIDGLESYRQIASGATRHLRPHGVLIVEHGFDQGESVPALLREAGFSAVTTHRDLAGHPRVTTCRRGG